MRVNTLILALVATVNRSIAQDYDYQDYAEDGYEQDNLYEDYAMKHQEKDNVAGGGGWVIQSILVLSRIICMLLTLLKFTSDNRFGYGQMAMASAASYFLGAKIHSGRIAKKIKKKHKQDQKTLYTQYYNDVYKLEEQKAEQQILIDQLQRSLLNTNEAHEMENLQREYDEFKQPDIDGDDQISRTEFNMYVKNYLANYPGLAEKDYPKFEDFDHDKDGQVSFQEYAQQMGVQAQQAELDQYYAQSQGQSGTKEAQKANALYDLYSGAAATDGFNDLYAQIRR